MIQASLVVFALWMLLTTIQLLWLVWRVRRLERCAYTESMLNGKVDVRRCRCSGELVK